MAAETALQGALYTALTGIGLTVVDAGQQAADGGDAGPFPYVEVGMIVLTPYDTNSTRGHQFVARIHSRSRSSSMAEVKGIQGEIWDRLHLGQITVTGHHDILLRRDRSEVMRTADGAFHGVCEYRGLIEET